MSYSITIIAGNSGEVAASSKLESMADELVQATKMVIPGPNDLGDTVIIYGPGIDITVHPSAEGIHVSLALTAPNERLPLDKNAAREFCAALFHHW